MAAPRREGADEEVEGAHWKCAGNDRRACGSQCTKPCQLGGVSAATDSLVYQNRTIHSASWAAPILGRGDGLDHPVGRLSAGDSARVLTAQLMPEPAVVLRLEEGTNDLGVPTPGVIEES